MAASSPPAASSSPRIKPQRRACRYCNGPTEADRAFCSPSCAANYRHRCRLVAMLQPEA